MRYASYPNWKRGAMKFGGILTQTSAVQHGDSPLREEPEEVETLKLDQIEVKSFERTAA
jgi:hypothetical protein